MLLLLYKGMKHITAFCILLFTSILYAEQLTIPVWVISDQAKEQPIGTITLQDTKYGVLITPNLHGLPQGTHGFHVHEKPSCAKAGMEAGGHFDPLHKEQHKGPYQDGHLGDLPVLIVNQDGTATLPILAPRFTVKNMYDHALMIHQGADNYADTPEKLGGGGKRMACGVIKRN